MRQLDPKRLMLARPAGYGMECQDLGSWLFLLGYHIAKVYSELDVCLYQRRDNRIAMMRNNCVQQALENQCGYMLMIDPDARMDPYVKKDDKGGFANRFRPFFDASWQFMQSHRTDPTPYVLAVPACSGPPEKSVQVFKSAERFPMPKIPRQEAAGMTGWHRVGAVGTHAMLIDMHVFDRMDHPYFDDVYRDNTHTELLIGQDVYFCRECTKLGIPVLVNFDCWSDHWQNVPMRMPGADEEFTEFGGSPMSPPSEPPPQNKPTYTCWE